MIRAVYRFPFVRALLVAALVAALLWRYWVAPAIESLDRVTPWHGIVPGSCAAPAQVRPAGFPGLFHDAGRVVRDIAEGPPTPAEMVGWFESTGRGAKTAWVAFDGGTKGQPLGIAPNLAPTPVPRNVTADPSMSGTLTPQQVADLAASVGWPAQEIPNVVARVMAESGGDPQARDYADGTHHGLLQLGAAEQARYLPPGTSAFDPRANLTGALGLWQDRGWQPWAASDSAVRPVALDPVQPVACAPTDPGVMTASLEQYGNGQIPHEALSSLSWTDGRLRADAAAGLEELNVAYRATFGRDLAVSDTYRDLAGQHACTRAKGSLCAKPGTSLHGLGIAVDLGGGVQRFGTAEHEWMRTHGPAYGWTLPGWAQVDGSKPEPWHWEFSGGQVMRAG